MVDGLLPSALTEEGGPQDKRVANLAKRGTPAPVKSMSRQLSDKDFVRRHIAEIDSRDERIKQLENLVAVVKGYAGSPDRNSGDIMAAIKDFEQDAEHVIPGVDDVKGEVEKLRKTNERLEIVCQDQAEKLEMLSRQLQAERASRSRSRTPPDQVKFEESSMYRKMRLEIEEQRRQIAELRAVTPPVLQERKQSVTSIGSPHFGRSSSTDPNSPRVKDLEIALDKERRVRNDMQAELLEKIASLEAELAIAKSKCKQSLNLSNLSHNIHKIS
ncbi:hypothetical protein BJ742DRAFT_6716 [Cladochytrium replicatum]|nr:hypothetical protein BJ742DRAFT_6716 [Cladochytrium replicatum]